MKKTVSFLLLVCMFISLFSVMAFAAGSETAQPKKSSDVQRVFNSGFYIAENKDAGLAGKVTVAYDPGGTIGKLYLPGEADAAQLYFSWDDNGITVSRNGKVYQSGTAPVAPAGESVTYKVKRNLAVAYVSVRTVQGSAGVDAMFLELDESQGTIDAMNSDKTHETKCVGVVRFDGAEGAMTEGAMTMKGRGNSTWGLPKKPYNITLDKKSELIPGVQAKKWSLLANFFDNSLMRNKIAMDLAYSLGIGLKSRFVDVWMNGEYLGNYLMTPKSDYAAPKGGFHLENDNYLDAEDPQFKIPGMYAIGDTLNDDGYFNLMTIKDIGSQAKEAGVDEAYIENYFTEAWYALEDFDSENYQNYFDLDSWAKMFLMYEVTKTYDCFSGSLLMHRDGLTENDKLIAGPAWDYDISLGRTLHKFLVGISEPMQLNAEGWYNDSIGLIAVDKPVSLMQELGKHASFMQHVAKVYNENKAAFEGMTANVDAQQTVLCDSALMNNVRWGTHNLCAEYLVAPATMHLLGTGKYALNYRVTINWDAYVANLREFAAKRVMWLSDALWQAEAPVGSIERSATDAGDVLSVVLTAGNAAVSYQWQRSEDGAVWTNVEGATAAQLTVTDAAQYRCVVSNAGAVIWTTHGGKVPTYAQTTLNAPAGNPVVPEENEEPSGLSYNCYTYIGDSISWGYGLGVDNHDPFNVGKRVEGAFTDLVADALEADNSAITIHPAASSGARLCDYRYLLERGMDVENPYDIADDWYGQRHPERTERLRAMGPDVVSWVRESDLVTMQLGINDLTAALVNSLYATGVVDLNKLTAISDPASAADYLKFAMENFVKDPNLLGNLTSRFAIEVEGIRTNAAEIVKDLAQLAPNADIVLVGYHKAVQGLRVLPLTQFSPIFDIADAALVSLNDYFKSLAEQYDNVYYVDAPDAAVFYPEGTNLIDIVKDIDGFLMGVHPNAEGHAYIADRVLSELRTLHTCSHDHTASVCQPVKLGPESEYISTVYCTDCGRALSSAKVSTPCGDYYLPTLTTENAVTTAQNNFFKLLPFLNPANYTG